MTKQLLLSALAVAALSLSACSSEPSDWRPDKKVSVDMVEPGTRSSDNFDQATAGGAHHEGAAAHHEGAGAMHGAKGVEHGAEGTQHEAGVATPPSSNVNLDRRAKPTADGATSANAKETLLNKSDETAAEKATTADPAAKAEKPE
ncbi:MULTISPECIES: hypothetical protein [Hymenobacter]|jgi:hypothetical protein|uniref:Lipoprotein n=1 Tax=Hymenobacter yonginensis TaxID=748197 RepID=A0ABY7PP82_9BACT|nr:MULTISPECIES: hypothetical protein [Hymenobacter]AII52076.1 hypothetical protein N008_08800 [Hymenobacter sp. APR13]WBO84008.1 hypothetical protein O9Z63_16715 [Hymenobacter yonginensis]